MRAEWLRVLELAGWTPDWPGARERAALSDFVEARAGEVADAVDVTELSARVADLLSEIRQLPPIDYAAFALSRDLPAYAEVHSAMSEIQHQLAAVARLRDACEQYASALRAVHDALGLARAVLLNLVLDDRTCPNAIVGGPNRERFAAPLLCDLDAVRSRAGSMRADLSAASDGGLANRQALLLRADSAVRLLVGRALGPDYAAARLDGRNHVDPPSPPPDTRPRRTPRTDARSPRDPPSEFAAGGMRTSDVPLPGPPAADFSTRELTLDDEL